MVGGRDFEERRAEPRPRQDGFGLDWGGSGRGAGSSFKPFVLAEAIRQDISLDSMFDAPGVDDVPRRARREAGRGLGGGQLRRHRAGRARPRRRHPGLVEHRLRAAHARGRARRTWPTWPTASASAAELPAVPSLVLGSGDVSPLDMAVGYSTFANRGVHNDPVMIAKIEQVDEDGDVERARPGRCRPAIGCSPRSRPTSSPTACEEVVEGGTGTAAAFGKPAAGKTGTTQDNKDAWFVGYTPELTAAVWMGYADPLPDGTVPTMDADVRGRSEPRAERRHRRQPAGRDLAQVHAGRHRGRRHRLASRSPTTFPGADPQRGARRPTTTTEADLVHQLHDDARAPTSTTVEDTTHRPRSTTEPTTSTTTAPDHHDDRAGQLTARSAHVARPGSDESRAGSWCGRGSTSARPRRAPRPSPPGPTPRA